MIDENAFGILIGYLDVEDDEYSLEREAFVEKFSRFRDVVYDYVAESAPAGAARALDLGHAIYFEFAEGEESVDLIAWTRELRSRVGDSEFANVAVVTHGSRWSEEDEEGPTLEGMNERFVASVAVTTASHPSEPLRRALAAEVATHATGDEAGWGPGLYLDTEAVEALGRTPKNAPTVLEIAGATFYRAGT
jgi:hypothetical protein